MYDASGGRDGNRAGSRYDGRPFCGEYQHNRPNRGLGVRGKGSLWFQLYLQKVRGFTQELIQRVEAAGCEALCVTVDTPVLGVRPRQLRAGFRLPSGMKVPHRHDLRPGAQSISDPGSHSNATWRDIEWLRSITKIRFLIKGILHPDDAELALQHEVDGLIVSNHGARNLDSVVPTIEALPRIAERVGGELRSLSTAAFVEAPTS